MIALYIVFSIIISTSAYQTENFSTSGTTTAAPCQIFEGNLPVRGAQLVGVLRRALEIVTRAPNPTKRARRGPDFDNEARQLLRFLTQDDSYETAISSQSSSQDTSDTDFC